MKSTSFFRISLALLVVLLTAAACAAQKGSSTAIERISVIDAQKLVKTGDALLVCSYDDNRCKDILFPQRPSHVPLLTLILESAGA